MNSLARLLSVCIAIVIISLSAVKGWQSFFDYSAAGNTADTSQQLTYTANESALQDIQSIINNSALGISVSITDLQTGKSYHYGDTASFTAASVGKLVTAAAFLYQVDQGKASLDQQVHGKTAQKQLQLMIVESDNPAWHDMKLAVGTSAQQAYAESLNLTGYDASTNAMTTDDAAQLLSKLAKGSLLSERSTDLLLGYMRQANYRGYIVAAAPNDVTVYHKVGLLEDRVHDVAIIQKGGRSYILAIFSKSGGAYNFGAAPKLFKSITDDTLQAFFGSTN